MKKALVTFILIAILISSNIVTMASEFTDLGIKIKVPKQIVPIFLASSKPIEIVRIKIGKISIKYFVIK